MKNIYEIIDEEKIYYINHTLLNTKGMIAHSDDITAIIIDNKKISTSTEENTILIHELGHYKAGAYYTLNSSFDMYERMEHKADKQSWEMFFPYRKIKELMHKGLTTVTQLAEYFNVEPLYMARCVHYYYEQYNGFN